MDKLTTQKLVFAKDGDIFTGEYRGRTDEGFIFADVDGINFASELHPHIGLGCSKIKEGDAVQIQKTKFGFDMWKLDATEKDQWKNPPQPAKTE